MLEVLEGSPEGVIVVRHDGVIRYANAAARSLMGSGDGGLIGDHFGIPTVAQEAALLDIARTRGLDPRVAEMRVVSIDWQGEPAYLTFFRDVTGHERLRDEVGRLSRLIQDLERRNDDYLAVLAHELRNPLMPILSALELMRRPEADGPIREQARDLVEHQVLNVARLIDDLMSSARTARGRIRIRRSHVELSTVVDAALDSIRHVIRNRKQTLRVDVPASFQVDLDPTWIEQALFHLLQNASKYTDPGGAIELSAAAEAGELVIRVRDDGVGISPEMIPHVFELFSQEERSLDRSQGGLGIGLAMVNEVVEQHGGAISVVSEGQGRGSEFIVRLPLGRREAGDLPARPVDTGPRAPLRVLIVDDNRGTTGNLSTLIQLWGHEVKAATDARTGLTLATEFRPDVILLDLGLPDLDGYEAVRRLREQPATVAARIVAMTGRDADESADWRRAGFDEYLLKPLDLMQLERYLEECDGGGEIVPARAV